MEGSEKDKRGSEKRREARSGRETVGRGSSCAVNMCFDERNHCTRNSNESGSLNLPLSPSQSPHSLSLPIIVPSRSLPLSFSHVHLSFARARSLSFFSLALPALILPRQWCYPGICAYGPSFVRTDLQPLPPSLPPSLNECQKQLYLLHET